MSTSDKPQPSPDERDTDPIPLSALQHWIYCPRQCALIHLERLWAESRLTAEGRILHLGIDEPGQRRRRHVRRVTALPLYLRRLNIGGVADLVEFIDEADGETPYPVEFKRGKAKLHRADEVQLCAQALCLEEMTGRPVPEGALYYAETKRRLAVPFDVDLRALTERTAIAVAEMFASRRTPAAEYSAQKCRACSLLDLCRPKAGARSARSWRSRQVAVVLSEQVNGGTP